MRGEAQGRMETFCALIAMVSAQVYAFVRTYQTLHLEWVHFVVYKLYLNKVD